MSEPAAREVLAWARLPAISATIHALAEAHADALLYLERVPSQMLNDRERQQGIRLEPYQRACDLDQWERGRLFHPAYECKWERYGSLVHLVYCGPHPPDGWTIIPETPATSHDQTYYLWGKRVSAADCVSLGLSPDARAFVELQIPRILRYPVSESAERVCLIIREWYTAAGQVWYARWCALHEEPRRSV
jgi:hypothetical protein